MGVSKRESRSRNGRETRCEVLAALIYSSNPACGERLAVEL